MSDVAHFCSINGEEKCHIEDKGIRSKENCIRSHVMKIIDILCGYIVRRMI